MWHTGLVAEVGNGTFNGGVAIDPSEFGRTYTETDAPIEDDGELNTGNVLERK